jgi:hypothetical protein
VRAVWARVLLQSRVGWKIEKEREKEKEYWRRGGEEVRTL